MGKRIMVWIILALLVGAVVAVAAGFNRMTLFNLVDRAIGAGKGVAVETGLAYGPDAAMHRLDIYRPEGAQGPLPVIIFIHGGSWRDGNRTNYAFAGRGIAQAGFVAVVVDYRKAPDHRFPAFVQDVASAVLWARANIAAHGGDPDRITISGHSAGAHIAAMVALDGQWLTKAGGKPEDVKALVGIAGPYDFLPFTTEAAKDAFKGTTYLEITQPISFARPDAPPALLLTGDADEKVKPRNSHALAAALVQQGARATVKLYPGLDHSDTAMALSKLFRSKGSVLQDMADFARSEGIPRPEAKAASQTPPGAASGKP